MSLKPQNPDTPRWLAVFPLKPTKKAKKGCQFLGLEPKNRSRPPEMAIALSCGFDPVFRNRTAQRFGWLSVFHLWFPFNTQQQKGVPNSTKTTDPTRPRRSDAPPDFVSSGDTHRGGPQEPGGLEMGPGAGWSVGPGHEKRSVGRAQNGNPENWLVALVFLIQMNPTESK